MIVNADNLGVSTFKEYAGITSFLESQKKENPLAATLLTNTSFFNRLSLSIHQNPHTGTTLPKFFSEEGYRRICCS
ncbi:MAG: hypothetical protein CM15mP22_6790 [Gammaproteobacteria bacterium]|nr:MAG: hypothetical protein CM15mP22_6790 [Gammaproteobacteria bacterium]